LHGLIAKEMLKFDKKAKIILFSCGKGNFNAKQKDTN
jgi:hypothetical protein